MKQILAIFLAMMLLVCQCALAETAEESASENTEWGIVASADAQQIELLTASGSYAIDVSEASISMNNPDPTAMDDVSDVVLDAGTPVKVDYTGDLDAEPKADSVMVYSVSLVGDVVDAGMSTISVKTIVMKDGAEEETTLALDKEDAVVYSDHGLLIGDAVAIVCEGDVAADPNDVTVHAISVLTKLLSGTVASADKDAANVAFGAAEYSFPLSGALVNGDIAEGDQVDVLYLGDLNGDYTTHAITVTRAAQAAAAPAPKAAKKSEPAAEVVHKLSGTVTKENSSEITIKTAKGNHYSFEKSHAKVTGAKHGIHDGDDATIRYTGKLGDNPKALSIAISRAPVTSTVSGKVTEVESGMFVILTAKGNHYEFKTHKSTKVSGASSHIAVGDNVKVTFTGKLGHSPVATSVHVSSVAKKYKTVSGLVQSELMSTITMVRHGTGKTYTIPKEGKITAHHGIEPGYDIVVRYTGSLASANVHIISIKVTP